MESQLVFLIGSPRSGTTWVLRSLATHPSILGMSETHLFRPDRRPPELKNIQNAPFWKRLLGLSQPEPGEIMDWHPHGAFPILHPVPAETVLKLQSCLDNISTYPSWPWFARAVFGIVDGHCPVIVEKTPQHVTHVQQIKATFPKAKFIGIVRDGRDVLCSVRPLNRRWSRELTKSAEVWTHHCRALAAAKRALPLDVKIVRYEDLHSDYPQSMKELLDFVGVEADPTQIREIQRKNTFEAYTGRAAGEEIKGQFFRKGIAGGFLEELSPEEITAYEEVTAETLEEFGYPLYKGEVPTKVKV